MSREQTTLGTLDEQATTPGPDTVIDFPAGLPGLEQEQRWQLVQHQDAEPFYWLRSVERPGLALLVVEPGQCVPGYAPRLPRSELARLEATEEQEAPLLLAVVTLRDSGRATLNLRAPVVIFPQSMRGSQVILDDARWSLRHPLGPEGE